jgi:DNA-binding transcriptional LysR family regulator
VKVVQMTFEQQVKALHAGSLDAGFCFSAAKRNGIQAETVWTDPVAAVLPAQHPLAQRAHLELKDIAREPLVLWGGRSGAERYTQVEAAVLAASESPNVVDHAGNQEVLLTLVGAGYAVGFVLAGHAQTIQRPDIVVRPITSPPLLVKTLLLYRTGESSGPIASFLEHTRAEFDNDMAAIPA